jgi:predicted nucleic acid-binding Zn ribbon protein
MSPEDRVGDILDPALRSLGVRTRVREERLRLVLGDVVGPALAPMCRAERLERGVLLIATANSALAHQLQLEAPRLIDAFNHALGAQVVRRLRFGAM